MLLISISNVVLHIECNDYESVETLSCKNKFQCYCISPCFPAVVLFLFLIASFITFVFPCRKFQ